MSASLDLRKTENDVRYLVSELGNVLKVSQGICQNPSAASAAQVNARQITSQLLQIQSSLQRHLSNWGHDFDVLQDDRSQITDISNRYQDARQAANTEIHRIRSLLETIGVTLGRTRQAISDLSGRNASDAYSVDTSVAASGVFANAFSDSYNLAQITHQTIPLLDADRYGNIVNMIIDFPRPQLGTHADRSTADIIDKIREGLGPMAMGNRNEYFVKMPEYFRQLFYSSYAKP